MIRIPVSDTAHARLVRASRWLCVAAYGVLVAVFATSALGGHLRAQAILKDAVTVEAPVTLDTIDEKRHKGRVSHTYQFRYVFDVDGVPHTGHFTTSEDNAAPYLGDAAQVTVAYARADPARFERLERLQAQQGLGAVLGRLVGALLMLAGLAFLVHLLVTRRLFVRQAAPVAAG
ncbi:DUF3592 domain-containing protein [Stenotrophomonas sp. LGBM10]|uniref:DUF3592 domain-containing protein n=1 Tax=Stenotrophomonas sp. LGBM10 TaxID=3390038 RepID=UPI00398AAE16